MSTTSSHEPATATPWDLIDGMLVINLDTSKERMEHFRETNAFLPQDKVHRLDACKGRELPGYGCSPWFTARTMERAHFWGGTAGCALSHRKAIATAKERGWKNVLVFEDDVQVLQDAEGLAALRRALESLTGQYMLYLGYSRPTPYGRRLWQEGEHGLWKVEGILAGYAYLVPASLYDRMLELMPTEETVWEWMSIYRAVDSFYRDIIAELPGVSIYAVLPDVVEHVDGQSDIAGNFTRTDTYCRTALPHSYASLRGICHLLNTPFRRLKIRLNAIRTHRRALKGGFPGFRKKKK